MKLNFIFNYEAEMLKLTVSKEKKIQKRKKYTKVAWKDTFGSL